MKAGKFLVSKDYNKNFSSKNISAEDNFLKNCLSLTISKSSHVAYDDMYEGLKLNLANTTNKEIPFNTQDNKLYMKLQAKDKYGNWKDIEYIENSFCGNSYYPITLDKKTCWSFAIPVFEGEFKTVMRAELQYSNPDNRIEYYKLYSNEVECSINPGQFWRNGSQFSNGIMYPRWGN